MSYTGQGESLVQLLENSRLTTRQDITDALQLVTKGLNESNYRPFLRVLLSSPPSITHRALELLLSSGEGANTVGRWIYDTFPDSLEDFPDSIHAHILERISLFVHFSSSFEREYTIRLHEFRSMVEYSPLLIQTLVRNEYATSFDPENINDDGGEIVIKRAKKKQKGKKLDKMAFIDPKVVSKAFDAFGLDPDELFSEKDHYVAFVHQELKNILKLYLESLQHPKVAADLQDACIVHRGTEPEKVESQNADDRSQVDEATEVSLPSAYPLVQPMKAALYFDSAEGFGEWRIIISTRGDRDLREARRKDAKFFKIIVKKIKELSNGHFSDDNQKRLNGSEIEIPIYEAKMTRDSRLIYQIDCIPEYDSDVEKQVIKIFGVYTHAQIDKRLWDSVGHQLGRVGKVYRQRCNFRTRPKLNNDKVFLPACFPPPEKVERDDRFIPEIPQETLEEIHSVLVLEKFITFSQALLNSMIADLPVTHVFNVSSQEKEIIEYQRSCYVLGRSGTGKTTTMLFKMLGIERYHLKNKETMKKPRQIFVTQSRVLAGKVEEYFGKLSDSLATGERTREELAQIVKSKKYATEEAVYIDIDDDNNWRGDLPKAFSALEDQHFPLFITFDRLASLLESDISQGVVQLNSMSSDPKVEEAQGKQMVSYETFFHSYWPHFAQNLVKGLDPALVFSEFMGIIQGSEEALSHDNRFLDRSTYKSLSSRNYAFSNHRDIIYSLFLMYLKQKRQRNEFDSADRTHQILKAFQFKGVPGQKIDFLYVDEVQDNLLIDAFMLRSLVRNPDGLFWAGDTAQTISVGSSFRFNDLKAFLFRLEKRREDRHLGDDLTRLRDPPHTFQLAVNYRSHGGIVQCAHSVIELITGFWPYAIDILSREKGVVDGSKPVFFSGWDTDTVRYEQFLFGESGNAIEFGARQCILVRDEAAREKLHQEVGNIGVIMTLYESKGLEFDDVLLYKFFEDSTADLSQWRVVLNLLKDNHEIPAPRFDEVKHAGICSELKSLYVGITRARKNLWLVDCSEKSEPMRVFWTFRNEIQNCTPGTDVPRLAVSSLPEEWEKTGQTLFANKRYFQAKHCFERAGMTREAAVSHTYFLRDQARSMSPAGSKQNILARHAAFFEAAESFLQSSVSATNPKEKKAYLRAAGDCFEHATEDFKAAKAYKEAEEYNVAAKLYRKCAKFDEAVAVVTHNRKNVDPQVRETIIDVARLHYFQGGELEKAAPLFDSVDEQLEYLEDFGLDIPKAALLEKLEKFQEAANIHLEEGRTMEAIRLFLMDPSDKSSIQRGITCILQGLWEKVSFGMHELDRLDGVSTLLDLALNLGSSNALEPSVADELSMFQLIKSHDIKGLRLLGKKFDDNNLIIPAIMCLEIVFTDWPNMYQMPAAEISELIGDFYIYCRLMQKIGYSTNPCTDPLIHKLFNISQSNDNMFLLRQGTFIYQSALDFRTPITANDEGVFVSACDLFRYFGKYVFSRLAVRIGEEHASCKGAPAFSPCLLYLVNDHCARTQCPRQHVTSSVLTEAWYILQIRIHFQQLLIVGILCTLTFHRGERIKNIRYWIDRIYQTMYPEWFSLGGIANFDASVIPEAQRALGILYAWCHGLLYQPDDHLDPKLLTLLCQITRILIWMGHPQKVLDNSFLANKFRRLPSFTYSLENSPAYIIPMHTSCLSRVNNTSLECGTLFVQHVLDKKLDIDAGVLCDIIDYLCATGVLVHANNVLHNVHLPLSWFRNLFLKVERDPKLKPTAVNSLFKLIKTLRQFINSLHMGIENQTRHLLLKDSNLANPSLTPYRGVLVARVCRAISLVGYNINNRDLRTEIVNAVKLLKSGVRPPKLYSNYAYVREWSDVARLVPRSTSGSVLDETIQLYHDSKAKPSSCAPRNGVHRLVYKSMVDIPRLLANPHAVISNLRADASVFVPRPQTLPKEEIEADNDVEEPEVDNTEIIDSTPSAGLLAIRNLSQNNAAISEQQNQAVVTIQLWYRKVMKKRRVIPKNNTDASRNDQFEACLAESQKMQWPGKSFYRLLYLGPLPHVLACLHAANAWAANTKKRNKKKFTTASHQDLEDIQKRLTDQKVLRDEIRHLQKVLHPSSELHRRRDVEELKKRVLDVEALLAKLGPNAAQNAKHDMAIGRKGIVEESKPPKVKPKPCLRIDDSEDEYEDYEENDRHSDQEARNGSNFEENAVFIPGNEQEIAEVGMIDTKPSISGTVDIQPLPRTTLETSEGEEEPEHFEELSSQLGRGIVITGEGDERASSSCANSETASVQSLPETTSDLKTLERFGEQPEYQLEEHESEVEYRIMQSLSWSPI